MRFAVLVPRDYQAWAVKQLWQYFVDGGKGNPLVCAPTGTGKSLILAVFIHAAITAFPGQRITVLTHVKELVEQDTATLRAYWPAAPVGVYSAGLGLAEAGQDVTVASVASVHKKLDVLGLVDLLFIDEAHLVGVAEAGMYRTIIAHLLELNPKLKVVGLTATPFRLGTGMLTEGKDRLFTDIAVDMTGLDAFNWFVDQGYLAPLVNKRTNLQIDLTGVKTVGGDYNQKQVQAACTRVGVTEEALREAVELGWRRRRWLVFCSGIEHAEQSAAILNSLGIRTCCVHSKMPEAQRDALIAEYRAGQWQAITNNGVLTTGFDCPDIDLIIMLRPTKSTGLWVQMIGRGTRPVYAIGYDLSTRAGRLAAIAAGPKQDTLVLDYTSNTATLGPINDPVVPKVKGKGGGVAPVRLCPECMVYSHASARECVHCGYVFPVNVTIEASAGTDVVMAASKQDKIADVPVTRVEYKKHEKPGKPPSLEVSYYAGLTRFRDWQCFEHGGYPASEARKWWRTAAQSKPPQTVEEALERIAELRAPTALRVWVRKRNSDVLGVTYG